MDEITAEKIKLRIQENLAGQEPLSDLRKNGGPIKSNRNNRPTLRQRIFTFGMAHKELILKIPLLNRIARRAYGALLLKPAPRRSLSGERVKSSIRKIPVIGFLAWWTFSALHAPSRLSVLSQEIVRLKKETSEINARLTSITDSKLAVMSAQIYTLKDLISKGRSNSMNIINEIDHLLSTEVEHYQPIYGVPATFFSTIAKRACSDRAKAIEKYFNDDVNNLNVLDIGSSLGYFCFYLADRGALTEGWDLSELNCHISNLTREVNGIKNARFLYCTFDLDTVKNIPYDKFDCALALSVFQHINNGHELAYSQNLIKCLLDRIPILIVELPSKNDNTDVYWRDKLPDNELEFFAKLRSCRIEKIGDFSTHLSNTKRSMYVISKKYITVNHHRYLIDKVSYKPYKNFSLHIERRYYYSKNHFIKKYHLLNKDNLEQIVNEINILYLLSEINISHTTRLVDYELGKTNVVLVLNRINGTLLYDALKHLSNKEKETIINKVLSILCELESAGIYHNDIRSWNIMIDNSGEPYIIDFGLASHVEKENNLVAFAYLVNSLITTEPESDTYNKKDLPAFGTSNLYKKYINPINSGKIKSFKNLYDETTRRLVDS